MAGLPRADFGIASCDVFRRESAGGAIGNVEASISHPGSERRTKQSIDPRNTSFPFGLNNLEMLYLVSAAQAGRAIVVLVCEAKPGRFGDFAKLFEGVARSVRISDDPGQHADQEVEVRAEKLKAKADGECDVGTISLVC
jgi:hypothetical protein